MFDLTIPAENGVVSGGVGLVPGTVGQAARISGGMINYGNVHDPGSESFSVSVWFQADRLEPGRVQRVVGKGVIGANGDSTGWQILIFGDEVAIIGGVEGGDEWFLRGMPEGASRLRVGEWNHAVMIIDRSVAEDRVRLFVNGAEIAGGPLAAAALPSGGTIETDRPILTHAASGAGSGFSGGIDEFTIWKRAISEVEISGLFRGGLVQSGMADLTGVAAQSPDFSADREAISIVLNPGESLSVDTVLANRGLGRAHWIAQLVFEEELTLEAVLDRVDNNSADLLDTIPFRFPFTDGEVGISIADGGEDMYDGGEHPQHEY